MLDPQKEGNKTELRALSTAVFGVIAAIIDFARVRPQLFDASPLFTSAGVLNAAAAVAGTAVLSPGSRAVIVGYNFASSSLEAPLFRLENGLTTDLPVKLNAISIRVDGLPAPILSVTPTLVEFQVPYDVPASTRFSRKVALELVKEGSPRQAAPVEITVFAVSPGIYIHNLGEYSNRLYLEGATARVRNPDGTMNSPSNPAHPGQAVRIRMTGLGLVFPTPENGQRGPVNELPTAFIPTATIGSKEAKVLSAKLRAGEVGIYDVSVLVPDDSPKANNVPLRITVLGVKSNPAVISIR